MTVVVEIARTMIGTGIRRLLACVCWPPGILKARDRKKAKACVLQNTL
jgi:hypothetical protein